LLRRLARMMRPVCQPLLHPQKIHEFGLVVDDVDEIHIVFRQRAHRRHHREHRAHEFAGHDTVGIDEIVDILGVEAAGPDVEKAVVGGLVLDVGVKIDRGDRDDQVLHLLRVQRGVARCEYAALANTEQRHPVVSGLLRDAIDGGIDVIVHVVVDGEPAFGAARLAPIDQPEIEPFRQQAAHQRTVRLEIRHGISPDQAVGQKHRRLRGRFRHRFVMKQLDFVAAHHEVLRRRTDGDVLILGLAEQVRRLDHLLGAGNHVVEEPSGPIVLSHVRSLIGCSAGSRSLRRGRLLSDGSRVNPVAAR
jgi:hypothetical protein